MDVEFVSCSVASIIVPVILAICGYWLYRYPPKEINSSVGYRTKTSMRDQRSWDYAQRLGGRMLIYAGLSCIVLSCAVMAVCYIFSYDPFYGMIVSMIVALISIAIGMAFSEKELKKRCGRP